MALPPLKSFQSEFAALVLVNRLAKQAFDQIAPRIPTGAKAQGDLSTSKQKAVEFVGQAIDRLNSSIRPRDPELGWRVGGGVFKNESPRILLTERKGCYDVSAHHALIANNLTTGSLFIYVIP